MGAGASAPEGAACGDLEREHGGVDVVVVAVVQRGVEVHHGVPRERAVAHHLLQTLHHAGDVLLGHHASLDLRREREA